MCDFEISSLGLGFVIGSPESKIVNLEKNQ